MNTRTTLKFRALFVAGLALIASPLAAQQERSTKARITKPKRPPLVARVVTDARGGLPVTVVNSDGTPALAPGQVGVSASTDQVENWLVGGPQPVESWLAPTSPGHDPSTPPANDVSPVPTRPVAQSSAPTRPSSPQRLVGVQHYMEQSAGEAAGSGPQTVVIPARGSSSGSNRTWLPAGDTTGVAGTARVDATTSRGSSASRADEGNGAADNRRYRLGPGDQIDVHVWRNDELSRRVPVRPDGRISLPLAGEILVSGKTVAELENEITNALAQFVQHPTVTVTVTEVRGMVIYVVGRVSSPGELQLDRPVNVVQAIAMAGGLNEFANRNEVVVIRTVGGREVRLPFRYGDALKGEGAVDAIVLQAGDVIYVQ